MSLTPTSLAPMSLAPMSLAGIDKDPFVFHSRLARFNNERLAIGTPTASWEDDARNELTFKILEGKFLEELRAGIKPLTNRKTSDADQFTAWFESLAEWGPGQHHPLFNWLANTATADQIKWFLTQEAAGEAGFDDLVAYTQVKLPVQAKLECARNYWDEMGRGKPRAMHGPLLENMVKELGLKPSIDSTVWESLALANTMLGLATSRRYTYHSLGALGVIELTAPLRAACVAQGMKRVGFSRKARAYFDLHAVLDVEHSHAWNKEIIRPLVDAKPECAQFLAEGALMRLECGRRCFDRYSRELGLSFPGVNVSTDNNRKEKPSIQKVASC